MNIKTLTDPFVAKAEMERSNCFGDFRFGHSEDTRNCRDCSVRLECVNSTQRMLQIGQPELGTSITEQARSRTIDATLEERGKRYGDFLGHAVITQILKDCMRQTNNWELLRADQKEALEMIAHKIGRILNGDPNYHDSWHDLVGYAKLVADTLEP